MSISMDNIIPASGDGGNSGVLDVENVLKEPNDLRMLGRALRLGWQVTPERKKTYFEALDRLIHTAELLPPKTRAMAITSAAKCLLMEQSAALKDLHQQEQYARLDDGKPTANVEHIISSDTPIRAKPKFVESKEMEQK
jgi:hypothetical protein